MFRQILWDSETIRNAKGGGTGACFNEETVSMTMITSLEFENLVPSRISSCHSNSAHHRFCAGADHPH